MLTLNRAAVAVGGINMVIIASHINQGLLGGLIAFVGTLIAIGSLGRAQ